MAETTEKGRRGSVALHLEKDLKRKLCFTLLGHFTPPSELPSAPELPSNAPGGHALRVGAQLRAEAAAGRWEAILELGGLLQEAGSPFTQHRQG